MKAIFKTNRIVVIATCLLMLFSTLSINVKAEEYDNYEFVAFITQCIENEKTISVLEKNGEDVTLQTKSEILRLYELNDYETLENYLNDNEYSISFIRDSNSSEVSRAFAVKLIRKERLVQRRQQLMLQDMNLKRLQQIGRLLCHVISVIM